MANYKDSSLVENKQSNKIASSLRKRIVERVSPILKECNGIKDSNLRMLIQAYCLDIVTGVEDIIQSCQLDK